MAGAGPLTEGKPSAVDDFELWLRHAPPGSEHCYATGVTWLEERKPKSAVYLLPEETKGRCQGS